MARRVCVCVIEVLREPHTYTQTQTHTPTQCETLPMDGTGTGGLSLALDLSPLPGDVVSRGLPVDFEAVLVGGGGGRSLGPTSSREAIFEQSVWADEGVCTFPLPLTKGFPAIFFFATPTGPLGRVLGVPDVTRCNVLRDPTSIGTWGRNAAIPS